MRWSPAPRYWLDLVGSRDELSDANRRDEAIVAEIRTITDAFEGYGYRRVGAELRHRGFLVNANKVRSRRPR